MLFHVKTLKLRHLLQITMVKEVSAGMRVAEYTKMSFDYEEAVKTLNSLQTNATVLQQAKKRLGQPNTNVAETRKYLARSGISQEVLDTSLSIIHVAGTKGKGSTCAFTESILRQHGFRTGFYSSPHLVAVRERIRIDGEPLTKDMFTKYFWEVYHRLFAQKENEMDMPPYFKFLTVLAFNVFLKEKVDVAIIEVGIGGELDCTNVIRKPVAVGITSLGLDHTSLLGNTVELIAQQKAGILKPAAPAYTALNQPGGALQVLRDKARHVQTTLSLAPQFSDYKWPKNETGPVLGLDSDVQQLNASLAIQLSHCWLRNNATGATDGQCVLNIDAATSRGLRLARWPGRAQVLHFTPKLCFFIDGAHTVDSIQHCLNWFQHASKLQSGKKPVKCILLFNSTGEREPAVLLKPFCDSDVFQNVAFCPNLATNKPPSDQNNFMVTREQQLERAAKHAEAWATLQNCDSQNVKLFSCCADVLTWLSALQSNDYVLHVLITGSLHLVGSMLGLLESTESSVISTTSSDQKHHKISVLPLVGTVH